MPRNDDLNKIRDAARRLHDGATAGRPSQVPPTPRHDRHSSGVTGSSGDQTRTDPPVLFPSRGVDVVNDWVATQVKATGWSWAAAVLAVWTANVVRGMWWGSDYQPWQGTELGRIAAGPQGDVFLAAGALALVLAILLGRWGPRLTTALAAVVGVMPSILPTHPLLTWFVEATPAWLTEALLDLGGVHGTRLKWVALLLYLPLTIFCLWRANKSYD